MIHLAISKVVGLLSTALLFLVLPLSAQFSQARLQATGLTCALCSKAIYQALSQLPFIDSVQPDLASSAFDIFFKPGQPVPIASLRTAVEDAGFFIGSLMLQLDRSLTETEPTTRQFRAGEQTFQYEGAFKVGGNVQVMDRGFVTEKEFKRLSSRYAYLSRSTSSDSVIHLMFKN